MEQNDMNNDILYTVTQYTELTGIINEAANGYNSPPEM